jgi:NAD(P)-dependent dehydrogenase (short-subunit alcohol dehydrogenase family)
MTSQTDLDFSDAKVVVVGASRGGIGAAVAEGFAARGASVTITGLEPEPIGVAELDYHALDVTDEEAVRDFARSVGALDVVVNCAGVVLGQAEVEVDGFRRSVAVNLTGHYTVAQAVRPNLTERRGTLIGVASMHGIFASPRTPAYGASKAAIVQVTKTLAVTWAPVGIRVNAVAPGFIETEQTSELRQATDRVEAITARTAAGRWGVPADLVGPILFLASDLAGFVTGVTIPVDGGYSVG